MFPRQGKANIRSLGFHNVISPHRSTRRNKVLLWLAANSRAVMLAAVAKPNLVLQSFPPRQIPFEVIPVAHRDA